MKHLALAGAAIVIALGPARPAPAQDASARSTPMSRRAERDAAANEALVKAAEQVRTSLAKLVVLDEQEVEALAAKVTSSRSARDAGRAGDDEVAASERELAEAAKRAVTTRRMLTQTEHLLAEATVMNLLARQGPLARGAYVVTGALITFNGPRRWSLSDLTAIQRFFSGRFNRPLPVSAQGQTAVHDRLGLDHREAADVALHPDSEEGQALMSHLRQAGIPFIAIRQAIAGQATGPHVHIGPPSLRRTAMP